MPLDAVGNRNSSASAGLTDAEHGPLAEGGEDVLCGKRRASGSPDPLAVLGHETEESMGGFDRARGGHLDTLEEEIAARPPSRRGCAPHRAAR